MVEILEVKDVSEPKLIIKYKGMGFTARCSACGKLVRSAQGCNSAGLSYAESGAKEDFEKHIKKCKD